MKVDSTMMECRTITAALGSGMRVKRQYILYILYNIEGYLISICYSLSAIDTLTGE